MLIGTNCSFRKIDEKTREFLPPHGGPGYLFQLLRMNGFTTKDQSLLTTDTLVHTV